VRPSQDKITIGGLCVGETTLPTRSPSHYDDDGYVIRWWRAMIPSNSLAALYGIAADCAERHVLGPGVAITIDAIDETHTREGAGVVGAFSPSR
jgi:hypothetical protein